ncbi:MAG: type I-C CRISPR-associated protein Cas8c/Csd1, partial [Coriobacteriia bacterium]|nr:type I-C CRISPR-associated protein Cas8c/Csd1 [Coriobacteriia bacterium]
MIISALASCYEQLLREHPDQVARLGWTTCKVKYQLVISEDGKPVKIIPAAEKNGVTRVVPTQVKRTAGVKANFLCDTASYIFGVDAKGKPDRAFRCFEASRVIHAQILNNVGSVVARAILAYYSSWNPGDSSTLKCLEPEFENACAGGNVTFAVLSDGGSLLLAEEDEAIASAWDERTIDVSADAGTMVCLATGEKGTPALLHPSIKGVYGAQSAGASLVSFNAPAFESYGHDGEQGRNAPVAEKTAQAYGLALNYLLSDRSHHMRMGDTTVVFWAEHADRRNTDLFSLLLGGRTQSAAADGAIVDKSLESVLRSLRSGKSAD